MDKWQGRPKTEKRKKNIKYFFSALALSVKIKSPVSFVVSILGFGAAFFPMLISLQLQAFTDNVQSLFNRPDLLSTAIASFAILALLYIAQTVFSLVEKYVSAQDIARIRRYLKEKIMVLLSSVPYKYIESKGDFREKVDFVKQYGGEATAGSISLVFGWAAGIVSFFGVTAILWAISPWIVLILILTSVPAVILSNLQKDETYRNRTKWMKEGRFTLWLAATLQQHDSMKEVRFFGLHPFLMDKWRGYSRDWMEKKKKVTKKHVAYNSVADILRNGVYLVVLLITAWEIYQNPSKGLGAFMLVFSAAGQLQSITTSLLINAVSIFSDVKYMEDFFTLLETEKEESSEDAPYDNVCIEFEDVCFSYPETDFFALDNLSVKINQGEKIAIVGANGSGKSTFVNLLCGLYAPKSGEAKINGDIIGENVWKARRSMSVIFQSFCQYQDTLRNNIAISDPARSGEDEEILALARQTGADEVISNQAGALDEVIGMFSDEGKNLSGGQWQKVAITRALFRKNARLYILDEPTAALDPIAEANIYRNFASLTGDKTAILISHRLGVTSIVDRILVFDKGKIVEDGNHGELMAKNGVYAKMYRAQAKWYR
ncbi:MAG: ABC transporter ATP-binding protein/permease [Oscillospiraceae bacterium]|nr:ABC transporter ATP-binding protein/permease [Oscillospiraceae bacterium]